MYDEIRKQMTTVQATSFFPLRDASLVLCLWEAGGR